MMIHIGQFNDPFGYFGNMPEIPKNDDKMDDTELKTVGCLYSTVGAAIFILAVVTAIFICWLIHHG